MADLFPCVKEIANKTLEEVPSRYAYNSDEEQHTSSLLLSYDNNNISELPQIPVIDMQNLSSQNFKESELEKLHQTCQEWGFFQLINHGVDTSTVEKMKEEVKNLFNLPMEEKKKYWQNRGNFEGFGPAIFPTDEQKLTWVDSFFIINLPTYLRKAHLYPNLPLSFREAMEAYSEALKHLSLEVLYLIGKALKIEAKEIKELFEDGMLGMKMNYYPPCPQPERTIGLNTHSDSGAITILLQISQRDGLQVKKDGNWISIKPLPNAFVVNIGDILEIMTNGIYRSVEHRTVVNSLEERMSIATFCNPKWDGDVSPLPSLITSNNPALFKRKSVESYFKRFFGGNFKVKSNIDVMRVENEEK